MTEKHHLLTNQQFEKKFKDCTLNSVLFTHEAHLRLAYIHITTFGIETAIKNLCVQIAAFDQKFGDGKKFNKTVTIASAHVMNHFINRSESNNFNELLIELDRKSVV